MRADRSQEKYLFCRIQLAKLDRRHVEELHDNIRPEWARHLFHGPGDNRQGDRQPQQVQKTARYVGPTTI